MFSARLAAAVRDDDDSEAGSSDGEVAQITARASQDAAADNAADTGKRRL